MLLLGNLIKSERVGHFCRPLMVAHESGLSHPTTALGRWAWRIVSEDSIHPIAPLPTAVHPFPESQNLVVVIVAETHQQSRAAQPRYSTAESPPPSAPRPEIDRRRARSCRLDLRVVDLPIPAAITSPTHRTAAKGLPKQIQWRAIALRHVEGC